MRFRSFVALQSLFAALHPALTSMARSAILRWRLDKVPAAVWTALLAAVLAIAAAFAVDPAAAVWMLIGVAACFLAWRAFREVGRTVIAPRSDEIELVG